VLWLPGQLHNPLTQSVLTFPIIIHGILICLLTFAMYFSSPECFALMSWQVYILPNPSLSEQPPQLEAVFSLGSQNTSSAHLLPSGMVFSFMLCFTTNLYTIGNKWEEMGGIISYILMNLTQALEFSFLPETPTTHDYLDLN
jgi:hypothetical protein